MSLSAEEQELVNLAKALLPDWFVSDERVQEELGMLAKSIGAARTQAKDWLDRTLILNAEGATATDPDWLNQHAKDRGTSRQGTETDAALRTRLRAIEQLLTRATLLSAANTILVASGFAATAKMVELRRDKAYFGSDTSPTGTGGAFALVSGTTWKFTPTAHFTFPLEIGYARSGAQANPAITIASAANGGNNGTFTITGVVGDGVTYVNATGVANAADAVAVWTLKRKDVTGNFRDGRRRAYLHRGYRMASRAGFVIILPYATTEAVRLQVAEMVRQKKAAGVLAVVERRQSP